MDPNDNYNIFNKIEEAFKELEDEVNYYRRIMFMVALFNFNHQTKETYEAAIIRLGYAKDTEDLKRKVDAWVEQKRVEYARYQEIMKEREKKAQEKQ